MLLFLKQFIVSSLIITLLSSCAVVPTISDESEEPILCDLFSRSVELKRVGISAEEMLDTCVDGTCLGLGFFGGISLLSSAVISSSIYFVGNTVHYLEKSVRCDDESILKGKVTKFSEKMKAVGGKKIKLEKLNELQTQKLIAKQQKITTLKLANEEIAAKLEKIKAELDEFDTERKELESELKDLNL